MSAGGWCVWHDCGCIAAHSEDCLYMNVFTPRVASMDTPAPVQLFIHGGNFKQGFAGGPLYDGTTVANASNTVVVSIQYRLGTLGFLYTNETILGNYGLLDQKFVVVRCPALVDGCNSSWWLQDRYPVGEEQHRGVRR
jgi:carboxylesterase type B